MNLNCYPTTNFQICVSSILSNSSTLSITPPTNGNRSLIVGFELTRAGVRMQLTGAIRLASEAFVLGPWVKTAAMVR